MIALDDGEEGRVLELLLFIFTVLFAPERAMMNLHECATIASKDLCRKTSYVRPSIKMKG
eukprot:2851625-Ditylum_brightwellii.AAC.1